MGIKAIKKLEQTLVKFLNLDGWNLEWTGDGFKHYDACGFTRKGKPCVIEMPELNEIVQKYKSEEVVFLAFALNEQPKIESFLKKHAFDYSILPDSGAVIGDYKIKSYPAHIILDQNSKIAFSTRGLSNSTASEIDEAIEGLIEK